MPTLEGLKKRFPSRRKPPAGATTEWADVHPGATRNWHPFVWIIVKFIEWKWGVVCSTYPFHGENDDGSPDGERFAVDIWFGRDNVCADRGNTAYGVAITRFFEHRQRLFKWHYMIINHYYIYASDMTWRDYDPYSLKYCQSRGNANKCDCDHDNHLHIQFKRSLLVRLKTAVSRFLGWEPGPDEYPEEMLSHDGLRYFVRGFACRQPDE